MTLETMLLIACTTFSAIAVALLGFVLLRRRRMTPDRLEAARRLEATIQQLDEKLNGANVLTLEQLTPISDELVQVRLILSRVTRLVEKMAAAQSPAETRDPVALEHQVLGESWKQFRANKELSAAFDTAVKDGTWESLLNELTKVVPADLRPTFDDVVSPCREHRTLVRRIGVIPRVVGGTCPRLENDAEEVRRTRELAALLTPETASRLDFRVESWVTDTFLPFADLYLQRHQRARLEKHDEDLQAGVNLVRQVLRIAAVEPIDVTPGETPFDSTRHIGRSTTNDPRFSDGVITDVVRNGFVEGGQQVIRQPEVVVNRMR